VRNTYEESIYALPIRVTETAQWTPVHLHRRQANHKSDNREDQSRTKDNLFGGAGFNGGQLLNQINVRFIFFAFVFILVATSSFATLAALATLSGLTGSLCISILQSTATVAAATLLASSTFTLSSAGRD
jgi:hypothetical protein